MGTKTKLVTRQIEVGENDAFKNDILDRNDFGESLLNLVSMSSDELVISLDGKWGEGKTTFVKMWQGLLNEKNIHNIYINAFENDYSDDAFIEIAGAITAYIEEYEKKNGGISKKFKKWIDMVITMSKKAVPVVKIVVNSATGGIISDYNIEVLKGIFNKAADAIIDEKLKSYNKDLKVVHEFKDLLSKISMSINSTKGNPLVIIVDELDRCKPTYALDIIEKIKHLFSVKNVVFVLVMNRDQLEESVKGIYGQKFDAHTYLQKFINIETAIPKKISKQYGNRDIARYNRKLCESHEFKTDKSEVSAYLVALAKHFNLSLRQLERVYTNMAIFYATSAKHELKIVPIVSFLAVIKVIIPSMYDALLYQRITYEELCENTGLLHDKLKRSDKRMLQYIVMNIQYFLVTESDFVSLTEEMSPLRRHRFSSLNLEKYGIVRQDIIPYFAKKISMFTVA